MVGAGRRRVFDAHFHLIDPRFPLVPNQGFLPEAFLCADYHAAYDRLGLKPEGGAVVSGSFQGFDQEYLLTALSTLGPTFVGVTQLPCSVSDEELLALHAAGVRAIRFNLFRGGSEDIRHLDTMARRVHELVGWHVELYVDSRQLDTLFTTLKHLPRLSIDHLGLSREGWPALLRLVESGARVKATGFSRTDLDISAALPAVCRINPDALLFGSDLPCTRAPLPFDDNDIRQICAALDESLWEKVFYTNALNWYAPDRD